MNLHVLGSSSKGNCYILQNDQEALVLDLGVRIDQVKKVVGFHVSKVVGALITHAHGDHAKYVPQAMDAGIDVYASSGCIEQMGVYSHRLKTVAAGEKVRLGGFRILPFDAKHDAREPLGFLVHHDECGSVLYLTDSLYSPWTFKGLTNILIEANYSEEIINRRRDEGKTAQFLRNRIIQSHMSLETCIQLLKANDLIKVNNIVLIHLSDAHSDATGFRQQIQAATGKNVSIAEPGMVLELNKTPF